MRFVLPPGLPQVKVLPMDTGSQTILVTGSKGCIGRAPVDGPGVGADFAQLLSLARRAPIISAPQRGPNGTFALSDGKAVGEPEENP